MNIKSISIIGNEERTLYRICSHFRLSKAKQIRQQLANSREKRGFLYCYFLDNKKKFDYSVSAYKVVFRSHRLYLVPIISQHSFKDNWKQFLILVTNLFYSVF